MNPTGTWDKAREYERARRRVRIAWIALLLLLATSAAGAQWHLGSGNLVLSLVIAAIKIAIVGWVFMGLDQAPLMQRVAICAGGAGLVILTSLSTVDFGSRQVEPTAYQRPQGVAAVLQQVRPASGAGAVR